MPRISFEGSELVAGVSGSGLYAVGCCLLRPGQSLMGYARSVFFFRLRTSFAGCWVMGYML